MYMTGVTEPLCLKMLKGFFKHKAARHSTTTSLEAATSLPDSGFVFVNNSQGASASIAELSSALDDVLADIEFEGSFSPFSAPGE